MSESSERKNFGPRDRTRARRQFRRHHELEPLVIPVPRRRHRVRLLPGVDEVELGEVRLVLVDGFGQGLVCRVVARDDEDQVRLLAGFLEGFGHVDDVLVSHPLPTPHRAADDEVSSQRGPRRSGP